MTKTNTEVVEEFQEFGFLHSEHCACVQEIPDECDCGMKRTGEWLLKALQAKDTQASTSYADGYKQGKFDAEVTVEYGEPQTSQAEEMMREVMEELDQQVMWYNKNNQIPDSELGKGEEHWDMLRKIVRASLEEVQSKLLETVAQKYGIDLNSNKK